MAVLQSLSPAYLLNQKYEEIKTMSYYLVNEKDGISVANTFIPRLLSNNFWNSEFFGSPFSCDVDQNGHRRGYLFNDTSQFHGFQYMNPNNTYCYNPKIPNSKNNCKCEYQNFKRLFPLEIRCRPWYLSSNSSSYVSFSDPYIDYNSNSLVSSATFKVVKQNQDSDKFKQVTLQQNERADTILGLDFNLKELQLRYKQENNSTTEYSYIVSATTKNFDDFVGYYEYTAITHPQIKNEKAKIYELEFQNSRNEKEDTEQFLTKTDFMRNRQIRLDSCTNELNSISQNQYEYITKNGKTFLTLFSAIQICYGNLYEQKVLTVGYVARCIEQSVYDQYVSQITYSINQMNKLFTYVVISSFSFLFIMLYFLLKQFLVHNFDIPISILNNFLQSADSKDIHKLNQMIEKGEFKTQYELQNIITAINSIVISVQIQVEKEMDSDECTESLDKIIQKYLEAAKVYFLVDHKLGYSLCMNNLGFIYQLKKDYSKALVYQQKANIISEEILQEFLNDLDTTKSLPEKQAWMCQNFNLFMNLHACRKFQLAQLIIKNMYLGCEGEAFKQYYQHAFEEDKQDLLNNFAVSVTQISKNSIILKKQKSLQNHCQEMLQMHNKLENYEQLKLYLDKKQEIHQKISKIKSQPQTIQIDENQNFSVQDAQILSPRKLSEKKQYFGSLLSPVAYSKESLVYYKSRKFYFSHRFYEKQNQQASKEKDENEINELFKNEKNFATQALDILYECLKIFQQINVNTENQLKKYELDAMGILTLIQICKCHIILQRREVIIEEILQVIYQKYEEIKHNDFVNLKYNQIPPNILLGKYYLILAQMEYSKKQFQKSLKYSLKVLNFNQLQPNQYQCVQFSKQIKKYYDPQDNLEALQNIYQIIQEEHVQLSSFQLQSLLSDIQSLQQIFQNYSKIFLHQYIQNHSYNIIQDEIGFFEVFFKLEKWENSKLIPL